MDRSAGRMLCVFFSLFASANPLIEYRLQQIDLRAMFEPFEPCPDRILDSAGLRDLALAAAAHAGDAGLGSPNPASPPCHSDLDHLFGVQAVTRSLILFNALFALQSALDLTYLWGGASLPDGMTYAHYAHRGAYPLIATALLAAGFVLIAMRPGGPAEQSTADPPAGAGMDRTKRPARRLVDLPARSLCRRLLADLSAARGLHLDGAGGGRAGADADPDQTEKPNSWLITANAISLALVLYGCCFINAPRLVASYNVEHSRENGGTGPTLDLQYLASLGPQALPPIEAACEQNSGAPVRSAAGLPAQS